MATAPAADKSCEQRRHCHGRVRPPPKASPSLYDLLPQIESSDDDVSQRVAQAGRLRFGHVGVDHAVDDEKGSDSEVSMRCEFVYSMAAADSITQRAIGRRRHQCGLGCLRNGLVVWSLIEAFANRTCQFNMVPT